MMRVEIENLKGITGLTFDLPEPGVWLLTGLNGSGKTSLLAALSRIRNSRAFQDHYRSANFEKRMDTFRDARIRYTLGQENLTYAYGGSRWKGTPQRNSELLSRFPYQEVYFVSANGRRIEPSSREFAVGRLHSVSPFLEEFMCRVLAHEKWKSLTYMNLSRGVGNEVYLLPYRQGNTTHYYSEKNFSLGELGLLRLGKQLEKIENESLLLIDEIEMALHPRAQLRLVEILEELAQEKGLTVLFSSHSSTLIRSFNRRRMIFLEPDSQGHIVARKNVYPAWVLGNHSFGDEDGLDFLFLVEDKQAEYLLEEIIASYHRDVPERPWRCKILPIGGWKQVLEFLDRSAMLLPPHAVAYAFLDQDVEKEKPYEKDIGGAALVDKFKNKITFLPCTPEQGTVAFLQTEFDAGRHNALDLRIRHTDINLSRFLGDHGWKGVTGDKPREIAKKKLNWLVSEIQRNTNFDNDLVHRELYGKYWLNLLGVHTGLHRRMLGPIFNRKL